jgi:hypothetical protein
LISLRYIPPKLNKCYFVANNLTDEWRNLSLERVHIKNMKLDLAHIRTIFIKQRSRHIYKTWVSYFDTPNDDNIAKHALLLYKQIN